MSEEKKNEEKDNCPLSPTDWIMLLSDEINNLNMANLVLASILFACALACLGGIFIFSSKGIVWPPDRGPVILLFFALFFISLSLGHYRMTQKKVEPFENLRRRIILGKEKDCIKIRDEWRNIVSKKRFKFI